MIGKSTWYKRRRGGRAEQEKRKEKKWKKNKDMKKKVSEKEVETVLFLPRTRDSKLSKKIQAVDDKFAKLQGMKRIKVVERVGRKLESILMRNDPWGGNECRRQECGICGGGEDGKKGRCLREGIVYSIECLKCKREGTEGRYYGESSRSGYERYTEHERAIRRRWKDHPVTKHMAEVHPDDEVPEVTMKVESYHSKAMERQVSEAVKIARNTAEYVLNDKSEWNLAYIPQILIIQGRKVLTGMEKEKERRIVKKKEMVKRKKAEETEVKEDENLNMRKKLRVDEMRTKMWR